MRPMRVQKFTGEMQVTLVSLDRFNNVEVKIERMQPEVIGEDAGTIKEGNLTLRTPDLLIGSRVRVEITLIDID